LTRALRPAAAPAVGATAWGGVIAPLAGVAAVDALYRRARAAGLEPEGPPRDAEWGERYFHLRDPDGHELSFAAPLAGGAPPGEPAAR
ncbi:MAG: hypothetical protein F4150_09150, partial [Chloroflexi bacterium]|nr:hypothetical protein [Chloroflexota bacterium]